MWDTYKHQHTIASLPQPSSTGHLSWHAVEGRRERERDGVSFLTLVFLLPCLHLSVCQTEGKAEVGIINGTLERQCLSGRVYLGCFVTALGSHSRRSSSLG